MATQAQLQDFIGTHARLFVLTGAGCSTGSGIPDYRDADGNWKRAQPVTFQAFIRDAVTRQRYWARSLIGWRVFGQVRPNAAHRALARLEASGSSGMLLTQNVDGLHQAAGATRVVDLHGRLDVVRCLGCAHRVARAAFQVDLIDRNPDWAARDAVTAPDGDADLDGLDFTAFDVPPCPACGGMLKPDVVFFGENVPKPRVEIAYAALAQADAMLVVGSSLMVYSGFRFVQAAVDAGLPVAAINLGRTRADGMLTLKLMRPCDEALAFLL